jgi:hypothetical protein
MQCPSPRGKESRSPGGEREQYRSFAVRDAKPEDPPDMRQGINIWGKVYDTVHWANTPLGSRSRGFVWFFSFLAWYEDIKRRKQNVILLLDEPGLSLHGRAQAALPRYFEPSCRPISFYTPRIRPS